MFFQGGIWQIQDLSQHWSNKNWFILLNCPSRTWFMSSQQLFLENWKFLFQSRMIKFELLIRCEKDKHVPTKIFSQIRWEFSWWCSSHGIESVKRSPSKQIQLDQEQGKIVPRTDGSVAKKVVKTFPCCWKGDIYTSEVKRLLYKTIVPNFGCLKFPTQTNWSLDKTC